MTKIVFISVICALGLLTAHAETTNGQNPNTQTTANNQTASTQNPPATQTAADNEAQTNTSTTADTQNTNSSNNTSTNANTDSAKDGEVSDEAANAANPPPASPHDPNAPTLAELQEPKESELSLANKELLAQNTALESKVTELTTQVNVLVNERTAQLYLYGALTAILSFLVGAASMWFVFNKKKSNW